MERMMFIDQVKEQLEKMSESEKDEWILKRAKLLSESEQQGFFMSLTGEKTITYMPSKAEIEDFCEKVQNGDIYVEYEAHYYEFDEDGRYLDDWKVWHNDPQKTFPFLNRIFAGCHDLIILGEYKTVADILDMVCRLEFQVELSDDSEDCAEDELFTLPVAEKEHLLSVRTSEIGIDWISALLYVNDFDDFDFAEKLIGIFELELCKKLNPVDFSESISEGLLQRMENLLEEEIRRDKEALAEVSAKAKSWREEYRIEKKLARRKELLLNIQEQCKKQKKVSTKQKQVSVLRSSWKQICGLFDILEFEPYIDDQWEIEEVWKISEALIKHGKFEDEDWQLRKKILKSIINHGYYDHFGCYDPMKNLSEKLCTSNEEYLEFADILYPYYAKKAARMYQQYGRMEKCVVSGKSSGKRKRRIR